MYSFKNDYGEGAHPRILQALLETNLEQTEGYGEDPYSREAVNLLKEQIGPGNVDIHFIPGGTQCNLVAISAFLRPHEAAIAPYSGHIAVHEAGAIEATGHKVVCVTGIDGKLEPSHVKEVLQAHTDEHMVKPKLVYISNSTEIGSIYTKTELTRLSGYCRQNDLLLFVDGARLGAALTSAENDLSLNDFARLVDAFSIGGTKNGALIGEALVLCRDSLKEDFRFQIKQKGALLAKGRLLGLQFRELFRDNLFFELARHANAMAARIEQALIEEGCSFLVHSPTNQLFPILPETVVRELEKKYAFHIWEKRGKETAVIRLVTSWATKEEAVEALIADLRSLLRKKG